MVYFGLQWGFVAREPTGYQSKPGEPSMNSSEVLDYLFWLVDMGMNPVLTIDGTLTTWEFYP